MKHVLKYTLYYPIFWAGYTIFNLTKKTPNISYLLFRKLYALTNGGINRFLSERLKKSHPVKPSFPAKGILGELDEAKTAAIISEIRKNGFYIFDRKADQNICDELIDFATKTPAFPIPNKNMGSVPYDRTKLVAPRYQFNEQEMFALPAVQNLVTDPSILTVAGIYLESQPINDSVTMWWSTDFSKQASSEAAQLYHFDMDRIRFIKFFIYLTDVSPINGPHCYVRNSHREKPEALLADRRFSDEEITKAYPKEDQVEINGPKGTIIAVDTSGFHKGKPIEKGERLLFQIEYTNSLFGQKYNEIKLNDKASLQFKEAIKKHRYTFHRIS
jgi:hypothetical protein